MSGCDIHDVCQQAERRWASKVIHLFILNTKQGYWIGHYHARIFNLYRYLVNSVGQSKLRLNTMVVKGKKARESDVKYIDAYVKVFAFLIR